MATNYVLPKKRMSASIERVFRPMKVQGLENTQFFREVHLHFVHIHDPETNTVVSTKLDNTVFGKWYKVAGLNERSSNGEASVDWIDPNDPNQNPVRLRLVALAMDVNNNPVFR